MEILKDANDSYINIGLCDREDWCTGCDCDRSDCDDYDCGDNNCDDYDCNDVYIDCKDYD